MRAGFQLDRSGYGLDAMVGHEFVLVHHSLAVDVQNGGVSRFDVERVLARFGDLDIADKP